MPYFSFRIFRIEVYNIEFHLTSDLKNKDKNRTKVYKIILLFPNYRIPFFNDLKKGNYNEKVMPHNFFF